MNVFLRSFETEKREEKDTRKRSSESKMCVTL